MMKSAFYDSTLQVEIREVPVPAPQRGQLLIRTIVSGANPKDWKTPKYWLPPGTPPANHGDDIAGYVEALGEGVTGFSPGDRVAAFHEIGSDFGSFAEYSISWAHSTFHIPPHVSFEEAATIPLAAMTASLALYQELSLPLPWNPAKSRMPLVIYGGSTAVGAFAIKLAVLSNIHPIAAVAGKGGAFARSLLDESKGDVVIDYRKGHNHVVEELRKAVGDDARQAVDAVSEKGSIAAIEEVLGKDGEIATVLTPEMVVGGREDSGHAKILFTLVGRVHQDSVSRLNDDLSAPLGNPEFGAVFFPFIGLLLAQRRLSGHPFEVVAGGLNGLQTALGLLEGGKLSATKVVIPICANE